MYLRRYEKSNRFKSSAVRRHCNRSAITSMRFAVFLDLTIILTQVCFLASDSYCLISPASSAGAECQRPSDSTALP